jgi:hypothetical protein
MHESRREKFYCGGKIKEFKFKPINYSHVTDYESSMPNRTFDSNLFRSAKLTIDQLQPKFSGYPNIQQLLKPQLVCSSKATIASSSPQANKTDSFDLCFL